MGNNFEDYETPMLNAAARRAILRRDEAIQKMRKTKSLEEIVPLKKQIDELNKALGISWRKG